MDIFEGDLVAALQELPETDPIEVDGLQLGGTCRCDWVTLIQTVCVTVTSC
ncbi:VenA family class IV lanthipeptide [Actinomadura rubrisoli]|uniref:VenA family class IV lanthipeptide n=1 Tax=Actinomadura rubrisoli TaxID=2530368 RepID=UPI00140448F8|nr:VenA family class IV lanthipeptide [Actinomadura rubrisoli]